MDNQFKTVQIKFKAIMLTVIGSCNNSHGLLLILAPLKSQVINFICKIY